MRIAAALTIAMTAALTAGEWKPGAQFYNALAAVESNRQDSAVGDDGKAVGRYQIWSEYVDDVNRICALRKDARRFTDADRTDPVQSLQIVQIYLDFYGKHYTRQTGESATAEVLARIHNGGPDGWKKEATAAYWRKVKKQMEIQK